MVWLFTTGSEPVTFIKKFFNIHNESTSRNVWTILVKKLVNCNLCSGFWIGLIYYQNLLYASIVSISAEMFGRLYSFIISRI